jgi:hypothetical protein
MPPGVFLGFALPFSICAVGCGYPARSVACVRACSAACFGYSECSPCHVRLSPRSQCSGIMRQSQAVAFAGCCEVGE